MVIRKSGRSRRIFSRPSVKTLRKTAPSMPISIKNDKDIAKMQQAGHVVSVCHQRVEPAVQPGVTTAELEAIVVDTLKEYDALASFLGYNGFPYSICASTNDEI